MKTALHIAQHLRSSRPGSFSAVVLRVATATVALGLAAMIGAVCVLQGFRQAIQAKVFSFSGHARVLPYGTGESPFLLHDALLREIRNIPLVAHVQAYAYKPALLKTENEVQGVVMKGLDSSFHHQAFQPNMLRGTLPRWADSASQQQVLVSSYLARLLQLDTGMAIQLYFLQEPARVRKLQIVGIYETGLEEYDQHLVLGSLALVRQLNGWPPQQVAGAEVIFQTFEDMTMGTSQLLATLPSHLDVQPVTQTQQSTFEWLSLIGRNVEVLIGLIVIVACFNMATTLLIMILERRQMVGVLQSMGATRLLIAQLFVANGTRVVLRGLAWGNALGLGLCALQEATHALPLDPTNYYIDHVPISWNWPGIALVNVLCLATTVLALALPASQAGRRSPVASIRFQ